MNSFKLAACALALAGAAPSFAVTIGTGTCGNCFPFGCGSGTNYQQVYLGSAVGAVDIYGVSFAKQSGNDNLNLGTYTLSFSTTSRPVNGLDTSNFVSNIGGDNTVFYTGTLASRYTGGVLSFVLGAPFSFDPMGGNLLLNITVGGSGGGSTFFSATNGDAGGVYSRAHNFGSAFENYGLTTTFSTTPGSMVPEPASWAMLIAGFAMTGAALRRRSTVRRVTA